MSELPPPDWPGPILHLPCTESTQDIARRMADEGSPEWTLVIADRQTQGRSSTGSAWPCARGGLYFSIILRPQVPPTSLAHLSLTAASAIAKAISSVSGLKTAVHPPNAVLAVPIARGSEPEKSMFPLPDPGTLRKVCGILAEASGDSSHTEWVVLGIGIYVNNRVRKKSPQTSSLSQLTGRVFELPDVLKAVLEEFRGDYAQFQQIYRRGLS